MRRKVLFLVLVVGLFAGAAWAVPITVENFSFELPGTDKQSNWENVPGWSSDTVAADSGVESAWPGSTEGVWSGFLMGSDPSAYNLTNHIIAAGETFTLEVDARNNWSENTPALLQMDIYYDNAGSRVQAATKTVELTDTWTGFSLEFAANDMPGSIGNKIGIELNNVTSGASWIGLDNVRIPEPATMALLALGGLALIRRKRS